MSSNTADNWLPTSAVRNFTLQLNGVQVRQLQTIYNCQISDRKILSGLVISRPSTESLKRLNKTQLKGILTFLASYSRVPIRKSGSKLFLVDRVYNLLVSHGTRTSEGTPSMSSTSRTTPGSNSRLTSTPPLSHQQFTTTNSTKTFSSSTPWSKVQEILQGLKSKAIPIKDPKFSLIMNIGIYPYSLQHCDSAFVRKFHCSFPPTDNIKILVRLFSNLNSEIQWSRFRTPRVNNHLIDTHASMNNFSAKSDRHRLCPPLDISPHVIQGENQFSFHLPYQPGLLLIQKVRMYSLEELIDRVKIKFTSTLDLNPKKSNDEESDLLDIQTQFSLKCPISLRPFTVPPSILQVCRITTPKRQNNKQSEDVLPGPPSNYRDSSHYLSPQQQPPPFRPFTPNSDSQNRPDWIVHNAHAPPLEPITPKQPIPQPTSNPEGEQITSVFVPLLGYSVPGERPIRSSGKTAQPRIPSSWLDPQDTSSSQLQRTSLEDETAQYLEDDTAQESKFSSEKSDSDSDEDDIEFDGPPSYTWPCRSLKCTHPQPISIGAFLQHAEMKHEYHCPWCDVKVFFDDIFIDGDFCRQLALIDTKHPDYDVDESCLIHDSSNQWRIIYSDPRASEPHTILGTTGSHIILSSDESEEEEESDEDPVVISADTSAWAALSDDDGFEIIGSR